MSFYGNITNVTKTGFSFDRTYANRYEMEANMSIDGIYIGRFVLVDYDQDSENVRRVYAPLDSLDRIDDKTYIYLYSDASLVNKIAFNSTGIITDANGLVTGMNKDDICYVITNDGSKDFFQCVGEEEKTGYAIFIRFTQGPSYEGIYRWNYAVNYNIDQQYYGDDNNTSIGRGWDSTVWQKVYENGKEKYVMIAELNSVVPTFAISADAPTLSPITPHFDEVSNNTYYEIHWQPQWGMRVKHANGLLSADSERVKSDETTTWIQSVYNPDLNLHQYYYYGTDGRWHYANIHRSPDDTYTELMPISFDEVVEYVKKQEDSQLPAAIYYNKAGFNSKTHYESSIENNFQMSPTGYSEKPYKYSEITIEDADGSLSTTIAATAWKKTEYNDHERGSTSVQADTQEWQMIIPSLGNAVSKMWDLVYGVGADSEGNQVYQYDEEGNIVLDEAGRPLGAVDADYDRLTYINWVDGSAANDAKRLRLVHEKENGFTYDSQEVETLAGCINSVHDLMGMIIIDETDLEDKDYDEFVAQSDEDKIYYLKDGGYYRRGIGYDYKTIEYIYEEVIVEKDEYQPNFYYYLENDKYITDIDNSFVEGRTYYVKKLKNTGDLYTKVKLNQYEQGKYYYKAGDNYLVENSLTARNVTYYQFGGEDKLQEENPTDDFDPTLYYELREEDKTYVPVTTKTPKKDVYYSIPQAIAPPITHVLEDPKQYDFTNETYQGERLRYFWTPGAFATKIYDETGALSYQLTSMNASYDPTAEYYMIDFHRKSIINPDTGEVTYEPVVLEDEEGHKKAYRVDLIEIEDNSYYRIVEDETSEKQIFIPATKESIAKEYEDLGRARLNNTEYSDTYSPDFAKYYYYRLEELTEYPKSMFYITNKFYYIDENNNFLKDKSLKLTSGRQYYTLLDGAFVAADVIFYKPNTYYYQEDDFYLLDKSFTKRDVDYYEKNYLYIYSDLEGLYSTGSQWNRGVEQIPCTIELAKRSEVYEMKVLNGFARTFNTIHGLILNINKILLSGDYHTRDRNTVQGCINLINDIIDRFEEDFEPRGLLISDNYGRIQSVPFETDEWLDTDIIGDTEKGKVHIAHLYPYKEENTTSEKDLNQNNIKTIEITLPAGRALGDVNGDGIINEDDSNILSRHIAKIALITDETALLAGDINQDGILDAKDSAQLTSFINNLSSVLNTNMKDLNGLYTWSNELFYYDINNENITSQSTAISNNTQIIKIDCLDGVLRVYVKYCPVSELSVNISYIDNIDNIIELETSQVDNTGHIINKNKENNTLPDGFKTITDGQVLTSAKSAEDIFAIQGSDQIAVSLNNNIFTIEHLEAIKEYKEFKRTYMRSANQVNFGEEIVVPMTFYTDRNGHITKIQDLGYILPEGSLINKSDNVDRASVLTTIDFVPKTGEISYTSQNVGNLLLTGYALGTDNSALIETDTINSAFSKLQLNINTANNNLNTANESINTINENIKNINDTLDIINGDVNIVGSIKQQINALNINNYLLKSEATGYDDILTKTAAQETYQTKTSLSTDVKTITYSYNSEDKILQEIIADLVNRITVLENPTTT